MNGAGEFRQQTARMAKASPTAALEPGTFCQHNHHNCSCHLLCLAWTERDKCAGKSENLQRSPGSGQDHLSLLFLELSGEELVPTGSKVNTPATSGISGCRDKDFTFPNDK